MSWMADMASYRNLRELKRRCRDLELHPDASSTRDAAPDGERADAAPTPAIDDGGRGAAPAQ